MSGRSPPSIVTIGIGGVALSDGHVPNGAVASAVKATLRTSVPSERVALSATQRQRPSSVGTWVIPLRPQPPTASPGVAWNGRHAPDASAARAYTRAPLGHDHWCDDSLHVASTVVGAPHGSLADCTQIGAVE